MSDFEDKIFKKIREDIDKDELDKDVNDRMFTVFSTRSRVTYIISITVMFILAGLLVWTVIKFYQADGSYDTIFWGVHAAVVLTLQSFMKLWFWLEMNRVSVLRNIKRLELEISLHKKERI